MFEEFVAWGYVQYIDIYRKDWELNKSLPSDKPKFHVINLNYRPDWSAMEEKMTAELWKKVWPKGDGDKHMARIIIKKFVDRNLKALIYSDSHHAFTGCDQPVVNENFEEAVQNIPNFEFWKAVIKAQDLMNAIRQDTNRKARFRNLK